MNQTHPDALPASRILLKALTVLNILFGLFILGLLVFSVIARDFAMRALMQAHPDEHHSNAQLLVGMRIIMVIGLIAIPIMHRVLTKLSAIVATVGEGDPFVSENALRLRSIAWMCLWLELLHLVVGAVAAAFSTETHPLDLDWKLSPTRWVVIVLVFVLARVFEEGTRMRDDLAATV